MRVEPTLGNASQWQALAPRTAADAEEMGQLYAAAVGPKNQTHYLRKFDAFDRTGAGIGWHWPAFLVTLYWLLYRKLWWQALGYFVAPYALIPLAVVLMPLVGREAGGLLVLGLFGLYHLVPPLVADRIYYRHCQKLIEKARSATTDPHAQAIHLAHTGGTSNAVAIILCALGIPAVIGILAAIALPAYQDYTIRAKTVQALMQAKEAGEAVGTYYSQNRRAPRNLSEAGYTFPLSPDVREMGVNSRNGVITVVMKPSAVAGKSFLLVPNADPGGTVVWTCQPGDMPVRLLPPECRQ